MGLAHGHQSGANEDGKGLLIVLETLFSQEDTADKHLGFFFRQDEFLLKGYTAGRNV